MTSLDLHGVYHQDVDRLVENFVLLNQHKTPLTIICGNSKRMIDIVSNTLYNINCESIDTTTYGTIKVYKV